MDTTASIKAAGEAFTEAAIAWRELGAPDLHMEVIARLDNVLVPLRAGPYNGVKAGLVMRRIVVRPMLLGDVLPGEPFMDVTAGSITHGVMVITGMIRECTWLGVIGSTARMEWEQAYYLRLQGTPTVVMCAGCQTFGARGNEAEVPTGWTRDAEDPDELRCASCHDVTVSDDLPSERRR